MQPNFKEQYLIAITSEIYGSNPPNMDVLIPYFIGDFKPQPLPLCDDKTQCSTKKNEESDAVKISQY